MFDKDIDNPFELFVRPKLKDGREYDWGTQSILEFFLTDSASENGWNWKESFPKCYISMSWMNKQTSFFFVDHY